MSESGVRNPKVIDVVTETPSGDFELIMVEDRPWDGSETRRAELKAKTETYLEFALGGGLAEMYPVAKDRRVSLRLDCTHTPDRETADFLGNLRAAIEEHGVRFVVSMLPET